MPANKTSAVSISLDLKGLNLDKNRKKLKTNLGKARVKGMVALITGMKQQTAGTRMKHQTGGFLGSIRGIKRGLFGFEVGPTKIYTGWIEEGSSSSHAPSSHKSSAFKGYNIVKKTADKWEKKIVKLYNNWIRRALK